MNYLYHVSPAINASYIMRDGINPAKARSKAKRSYYVSAPLVTWAIAHVSLRHAIHAGAIDVWAVDATEIDLKKFRGEIFWTDKRVEIEGLCTAEDWLVLVERQSMLNKENMPSEGKFGVLITEEDMRKL